MRGDEELVGWLRFVFGLLSGWLIPLYSWRFGLILA
jgi:hypothetical protein